MQNFDLLNKAYKDYIEQYLAEVFDRFGDQPQKLLYEAMQYSLLAGGKRIRPMLTLEFCRISGGDVEKAITSDKNPIWLAKKLAGKKLLPKIYIACGTEDHLISHSRKFRSMCRKRHLQSMEKHWKVQQRQFGSSIRKSWIKHTT